MRRHALFSILLLLISIQARHPGQAASLSCSLVFTQIPYRPESHESNSARFLRNRAGEKRSRIVALRPDGTLKVLTPDFACASDPSVSFDARRIVFAGKRSITDRWNIWEMDVDGKNKRQITKDLGDCREPEYLAKSSITPPDFEDKVRWVTFVSNGAGVYAETGMELATSLYAASTEPIAGRGFVTWRTTFNLANDFSPTVLNDGRVLFTSAAVGRRSPPLLTQGNGNSNNLPMEYPLLVANWDGTGLNLFCGNEQGLPFKTMACEMPDRTLVFVESGESGSAGGQLARVSFRRPLHSYVQLSGGEGYYLHPHPFADGKLAVSFTPGKQSYGIYALDLANGSAAAKLFDDPDWEDLDAQMLVPRPEPQGLISSVMDSLTWGHLHCLNVYESDQPEAALIKKGDVKRVRFIEGVPARASNRRRAAPQETETRILGEAPVEADGSFFVELPGDTPFSIQLLDEGGRALQSMHRWIWVRRGTSRGCIGCHENKELAPENRVTDAVRRAAPHVLK